MNPALLQKQLRDNAADLNDFYKELKTWGEEMKRKNLNEKSLPEKGKSTLPKKQRKVEAEKSNKIKIGYTDYSAWDKFDADAECEKIDYDEDKESDLSDECDEQVRDEAYLEKEKGNTFVKDKKWNEAITCYNKAIDLYAYDPVFYANRALCYLKTENHTKAELDCTMSLKLDATYVKAYQRRAAAREALGKHAEAEADLLKVLEIEPKNAESLHSLEIMQKLISEKKPKDACQRPISKFTASRYRKSGEISKHLEKNNASNSNINLNTDDSVITVKPVVKPTHLQSKKPLKRIEIQEVAGIAEIPKIVNCEKQNVLTNTLNTDDLKIIERHASPGNCEITKQDKNLINNIKMNELIQESSVPKNSVQFYSQWKCHKTIETKYEYFKLISPENLPDIFKESLESNTFSEILEVLVNCFLKNNDEVFEYLKVFAKLKRFSTTVAFMTDVDKNNLHKLFEYSRLNGKHFREEIDSLLHFYELV